MLLRWEYVNWRLAAAMREDQKSESIFLLLCCRWSERELMTRENTTKTRALSWIDGEFGWQRLMMNRLKSRDGMNGNGGGCWDCKLNDAKSGNQRNVEIEEREIEKSQSEKTGDVSCLLSSVVFIASSFIPLHAKWNSSRPINTRARPKSESSLASHKWSGILNMKNLTKNYVCDFATESSSPALNDDQVLINTITKEINKV